MSTTQPPVPALRRGTPADGCSLLADLRLKRAVDVLLALAGGAFYLPMILILASAVQLIDPGPVFCSQQRRGYRGKGNPGVEASHHVS